MTRSLLRPALVASILAWHVAAGAVPTCTTASGAQLSFGTIPALASTGDRSSNSGTTFWINCTADVAAGYPLLYSTTPRAMQSGGGTLPFSLSLRAPGGLDLPSASPGDAVPSFVKDGTNRTVTLHGLVRAADFRALPSGAYSRILTLTVEY